MFRQLQIQNQKAFFSHRVMLLSIILFLASACSTIRGSGNVVTEIRAVGNFDRVSLSSPGELILTQGDQESLEIEAEDNFMDVIQTEVRGSTLVIKVNDNTKLRPTKSLRFYLTMDRIAGLEISGSGSITADNILTDRLDVDINGSGDINIAALSAEFLTANIDGSGSIGVAGKVTSQMININGSGQYQADNLESELVDVLVSGAGDTSVWVNQTLSVEVNGSGNLNYYGNPTVSSEINGSGNVNSLGPR